MRSAQREAFSVRGAAQHYGVSRHLVSGAVRRGELPAACFGARRLLILRADLERWIRSHAVKPTAHAESVVERRLEREGTS